MSALVAYVNGVGLRGPGLEGWHASRPVLAGRTAYFRAPTVLPTASRLPSAERRRVGAVVRIALAVADELPAGLLAHEQGLPTIFSSSGGDGANFHAICETLASEDRHLSPTRFHNSVHNASSGYWSIATQDMSASNVLCAHDASFGAGLLEAMAQLGVDGGTVALVAYEADYPEPLRSARPIPDAFGIALELSSEANAATLARIVVSLSDAPAVPLLDRDLEALRVAIPSARGLSLLEAIAVRRSGCCIVEYLEDLSIELEIEPCN